jgi:hypothetical protein
LISTKTCTKIQEITFLMMQVAYCFVVFKYYPIVIARARICCIVVVCVLEAAVLPFFSFFFFFFFLINVNIRIELHTFQLILQVLKLTTI